MSGLCKADRTLNSLLEHGCFALKIVKQLPVWFEADAEDQAAPPEGHSGNYS